MSGEDYNKLSAKERDQERRDMRGYGEVYRKDTGEIVDRFEAYYDDLQAEGRRRISGRPELTFKTYKII